MKRLERLDSPLLNSFKILSFATDLAFEKRSRSQVQKKVNEACSAETAAILAIAKKGTLDEKIALECQLQKRDLEKYAKSPSETKGVKQGLKDMTAALVSYECLVEHPGEYRKQAAGYTDRNKDAKLGVPKDGMRYTLASQITRLQNRLSLQLSEEERVLLIARRALLDSLLQEYSVIQQTVMEER